MPGRDRAGIDVQNEWIDAQYNIDLKPRSS
jgi:hypothetical protein